MGDPKSYLVANAPSNLPRLVVDELVPLLVDGEHPALAALRQQFRRASIRQIKVDSVGFLADFEVPEDTPVASPPDFAGGHAIITLKGARLDAGCVLSAVEGYTYDDQWPEATEVVSVNDVMRIQPNTTLTRHLTHGRIAEVAWTNYPNEGSLWGRKILEEAVHRFEPRCLVVNLLGFDGSFGMPLLGALVAASVAMNKLGEERKTRILAAGQTAIALDKVFRLMKIGSIFGEATHPDLNGALGTLSRIRERFTGGRIK